VIARRAPLRAVPEGADAAETVSAEVRVKIDGEPVHLEIVVPAGATRLHQLMPVLHGLANLMAEVGTERAERSGQAITCRKGCGACCRQPVPVTDSEASALARLVSELPESRQREVRARFAAALERLDAAGLLETLRRPAALDDADVGALAKSYFQLGIACPFLEEEACSIHAERPLSCREFLVTSGAEHCANASDHDVRRVPLPAESFRAVRAIDARTTSSAGWTTLVLALEHVAAAPERPEQPSLVWLRDVFAEIAGQKG
jgi:Fe-S-cluster containining protein